MITTDPRSLSTSLAEILARPTIDPLNTDDVMERVRLRRRAAEQDAELTRLRTRMIGMFARQHGWRASRRSFTVKALTRELRHSSRAWAEAWPHSYTDHRFFFRHPDSRAGALAGHPYTEGPPTPEFRQNAAAWGAAHGLAVSFPDFPSWWFPGRTTLVLFTSTGAA